MPDNEPEGAGPLNTCAPHIAAALIRTATSRTFRTLGLVAILALTAFPAISATQPVIEHATLPEIHRLTDTPTSHAFSAALHQSQPLDLGKYGYTEEEYLVTGTARVFDWQPEGIRAMAGGPYTTRILVRRPTDKRRANGTVIVEPLNPSVDIDLPIMWAESHDYFMARGDTWVGITIKPNTIKALQAFDPTRYARVAMPNPRQAPACAAAEIDPWSQPTTPADETGLAWDMLSQLGALLKSAGPANPLGQPAARLYMTGQSQTAGYARLYASVFSRRETTPDGKPLYDGYLYSGSPPWQVPINQCWKEPPEGDPRLITAPAAVPVIELFTQGDMKTNVPTRRPDSDAYPDLFRRYEIAGASHVDPYEDLSFAASEDAARAHGRMDDHESQVCSPKNVTPGDFPVRYVFDAAWANLDSWVRERQPAPRAARLELKPGPATRPPDEAFLVDRNGNARGGVRTPYVDVPTARWVGAKSGPFVCLFHGYKYPFDDARLHELYGSHTGYVNSVRASVTALVKQRWLTPEDGDRILQEAQTTH